MGIFASIVKAVWGGFRADPGNSLAGYLCEICNGLMICPPLFPKPSRTKKRPGKPGLTCAKFLTPDAYRRHILAHFGLSNDPCSDECHGIMSQGKPCWTE